MKTKTNMKAGLTFSEIKQGVEDWVNNVLCKGAKDGNSIKTDA